MFWSAVLRAPTSALSGHRGVRPVTERCTPARSGRFVEAYPLFLLGPGTGKPDNKLRDLAHTSAAVGRKPRAPTLCRVALAARIDGERGLQDCIASSSVNALVSRVLALFGTVMRHPVNGLFVNSLLPIAHANTIRHAFT
jgi:hypothetical protein